MRRSASRLVLRASACHQFADSGAPRHEPSVFDVPPDDLSAAGLCATALARRHRTVSLGRVEVTDRDDMPPGLHHVPRPSGPRQCPAVSCRWRHEAAGQREAVSRAVARDKPGDVGSHPRDDGNVEEVEVVVAHNERATLRVGDVFLKIDADQARTDVEVEAMAMAPIPTPEILWRKPPALALAALPGTALGHLGEPSTASPAAWAAAGAAARTLHDAPLPPWPGRSIDELASRLDSECEWLAANDVLPADLVTRNRQLAETALRPWTPVFIHGDLQVDHVFVDGDEVTGVVDWSEASQGDALFDVAILTLGHKEHLGDVVAGYGTDVDRDLIRAWWSLRCLTNVRWLAEHGYGSPEEFPEVAVLRSRP
jgi:aminoglycoside phosphotransferase